MADRALVIDIHLLGERWHGVGDWPPSPFRVFQALVAGAYGGRWRAEDDARDLDRAFAWLEQLRPPTIAAPHKRDLQSTNYYVPDNDLDSEANDPRRVANIKSLKKVRSIELPPDAKVRYVWFFEATDATLAERIADVSGRLHLFGRGIDAAYATASIETSATAAEHAASEVGAVARPSTDGSVRRGDVALPCPDRGSLESLHIRYEANRQRFERRKVGRAWETAFRQPPKALSQVVAYERPGRVLLFELRRQEDDALFFAVAPTSASRVVTAVRDLLIARLRPTDGDAPDLERVIAGRGATEADRDRRLQIFALPSIGFQHTNPGIRRVAIRLPAGCPIAEVDIEWALAGRDVEPLSYHSEQGEKRGPRLVLATADARDMLRAYGDGEARTIWRSVTPLVLPQSRERGRINGTARAADLDRAGKSVVDALRHANVNAKPIAIQVQREPFSARGFLATSFEADRFEVDRLAHVSITFDRPIDGPLVIGDGRFLGLGVMAPDRRSEARQTFDDSASVASDDEALTDDEEPDES